jgi:hypothetical protein
MRQAGYAGFSCRVLWASKSSFLMRCHFLMLASYTAGLFLYALNLVQPVLAWRIFFSLFAIGSYFWVFWLIGIFLYLIICRYWQPVAGLLLIALTLYTGAAFCSWVAALVYGVVAHTCILLQLSFHL